MILPLEQRHVHQIKALVNEIGSFTKDEIDCVLGMIEQYLAKEEDYIFYGYEQEGRIIGFICYGLASLSTNTYDIYWIAVDKRAQNSGVGTKLLDFMYKDISQRNGNIAIAETSSQTHYEPTRKFYEKKGFILEARIKDYYKKGDDKLIYVKRF